MSFVTEPRIELIGKPIIAINGIVKFLDEHNFEWPEFEQKLKSMLDFGDEDASWICEFAGRMCYQSWPDKGGKSKGRSHDDHIKHLIEVAHGACIEHATFNFAIWNVSRSLTHELVRHRLASYSQLSQRYVDSSNVNFVVPPAVQELEQTKPEIYKLWVQHCERSRELYEELTASLSETYSGVDNNLERRKKARQAARSVLPNATETKLVVTMNTRAVRHFIELRANPAADLEIRSLAVKMFKVMENNFPLMIHGMNTIKLEDGTNAVESQYRKV